MIPVKIKRPLYIRKGPGKSHDSIGVASASGKTILMDGVKDDGETLKGISKWYYKTNELGIKQFYWAGRIEEATDILTETQLIQDKLESVTPISFQEYIDERFDGINLKETIDYGLLLNLPNEIKQTRGKNAVIGILDVPISTNINFDNIIRPGNILTKKSPTIHSNFIAGLIGSKAISNIIGICPSASIIDLSFSDEKGNLIQDDSYYNKLITSIKSFNNKKVIVNLSYSLSDSIEFVTAKFKGIENILFVCSAGTDNKLLNIDSCPLAGSVNSISVGSVSKEFLNSNALFIDKRLDVILPVHSYASFNKNGIELLKSTDLSSSWGTGIVSSIVALLFSANLLNNSSTKKDIITKIKLVSKNSNSSYNFLNPLIY